MAPARKVIVTCAITGSGHTPTMSPHLPITVDEIVDQSVEAAEAGAAIVHLHARDPQDGRPTRRPGDVPRVRQAGSRSAATSSSASRPAAAPG